MLLRILTAVVLIPIVIILIFFAPFPVFGMLLSLILVLAVKEYGKLLKNHTGHLMPVTYLFAALLPWISNYAPEQLPDFIMAAVLVILGFSVIQKGDLCDGLPCSAGNLMGLFYIGVPLSVVGLYHPDSAQSMQNPERGFEMLLVLVGVWISDAAAYFVGRQFGKHKVTPSISPKKSLEGYIAALVFPTVLLPLAAIQFLESESLAFWGAAGLVIAVAGTLGDLFESMLKRGADIKDSSKLIPGHGGVLDRLDSLLFAFPAYFLFSRLTSLFENLA